MSFGQINIALFGVLGFFALSYACIEPAKSTAECDEFYNRIDSNERERQFPTFDTEKQFRIYRCGFDQIPMQTAPALVIASQGPAIVPDLLRRLREERDPVTKFSIIVIFDMMADENLKNHPEIMPAIDDEIEKMLRGWEKDYSEMTRDRIKSRLDSPQ